MVKQSSFLLLSSILCVLFVTQFGFFLHGVTKVHDVLAHGLAIIFSGSHIGLFIKETLSLLIIPVVIALIPGGIYWVVKRKSMPYLMVLVWVAWIMLATVLTIENKITTDSDFVASGSHYVQQS